MKRPYFSVVLPTHNRAAFLGQAIQSVLNQTCADFELIVVDDFSQDETSAVVRSFSDARLRYVLNDHMPGGAGARNAGVFRASGDWIAFLDDDDIWLPDKLSRQRQVAATVDGRVGMISTGYALYDFENEREISVHLPQQDGWILPQLLYTNCIGTYSTVAVRTSLLRRLAGLDESFPSYQDNELYVRIAGEAELKAIREKLVYVRSSNRDKVSLDFAKKLQGYKLFWRKYGDYLNREPRLHHRIASKVFVYAALHGSFHDALSAMPWTVAGLWLDPRNLAWTIRMIASRSRTRKPTPRGVGA